jgi:Zn ribbon nucleic-acid-binding protein
MKCDTCKEELDDRDILLRDGQHILHCWRCGFKRQLTEKEKKEYIYKNIYNDGDDDWSPYNMYAYEV